MAPYHDVDTIETASLRHVYMLRVARLKKNQVPVAGDRTLRPKNNSTHLEPLDGVRLGNLVLVADLGAFRLPLRNAVSRPVEYDVEVHSVNAWMDQETEGTVNTKILINAELPLTNVRNIGLTYRQVRKVLI